VDKTSPFYTSTLDKSTEVSFFQVELYNWKDEFSGQLVAKKDQKLHQNSKK
jgi:hypothetical protein